MNGLKNKTTDELLSIIEFNAVSVEVMAANNEIANRFKEAQAQLAECRDKALVYKRKLAEKFTEIVAMRLDVYTQREAGVWPPHTELNRWRERYMGNQNLPSPFVELNTFRNEVDNFVASLMSVVDDV